MKITTYKGSDLEKSFRNYARHQIKLINIHFKKLGGEVVKADIGFYYFSGFAKIENNWFYFSISDVRHFPNEMGKLLIRKCKDDSDYTGETNYYIKDYRTNFKFPWQSLAKKA